MRNLHTDVEGVCRIEVPATARTYADSGTSSMQHKGHPQQLSVVYGNTNEDVNSGVGNETPVAAVRVPLTRGFFALVDPDDIPLVDGYTWGAITPGQGRYTYARAYVKGGGYAYMHRLLAGARDGELADHANGDTLDNRRGNLRICTRAQNNANQRRQRQSTRPYKGIRPSWVGKWSAFIGEECRRIGTFDSPEDAARAYDTAARERWGSFAALNFPEVGERSALTGQIQLAPVVRGPGVSLTQINNPATGAELLSTVEEAVRMEQRQ